MRSCAIATNQPLLHRYLLWTKNWKPETGCRPWLVQGPCCSHHRRRGWKGWLRPKQWGLDITSDHLPLRRFLWVDVGPLGRRFSQPGATKVDLPCCLFCIHVRVCDVCVDVDNAWTHYFCVLVHAGNAMKWYEIDHQSSHIMCVSLVHKFLCVCVCFPCAYVGHVPLLSLRVFEASNPAPTVIPTVPQNCQPYRILMNKCSYSKGQVSQNTCTHQPLPLVNYWLLSAMINPWQTISNH